MKNLIKSFAVVVLSLLRVWMLLIGGLLSGVGGFLAWLGGGIVGFAAKYAKVIKNLI
jgi:hypothetical protein